MNKVIYHLRQVTGVRSADQLAGTQQRIRRVARGGSEFKQNKNHAAFHYHEAGKELTLKAFNGIHWSELNHVKWVTLSKDLTMVSVSEQMLSVSVVSSCWAAVCRMNLSQATLQQTWTWWLTLLPELFLLQSPQHRWCTTDLTAREWNPSLTTFQNPALMFLLLKCIFHRSASLHRPRHHPAFTYTSGSNAVWTSFYYANDLFSTQNDLLKIHTR